MISAVASLKIIERNLAQSRATTAAQPAIKRESAYYAANIGGVKTSKDFVGNYRLFSYAMRAYGLSDMVYARAYMQRILDGGVKDSKSLANKLSDPRFKAFASAFDFGDEGASAASNAAANASTTTGMFVQQKLEEDTGQQNEGAQLALYFQRKAPAIKSSLAILADKALLQFVQTAYNLPSAASGSTIDQDAARIDAKLDIKDLQDPAKLQKLISRFAVMWDAKNTTSASSPVASMLSSIAGGSSGIDSNLLLNAQKRYSVF